MPLSLAMRTWYRKHKKKTTEVKTKHGFASFFIWNFFLCMCVCVCVLMYFAFFMDKIKIDTYMLNSYPLPLYSTRIFFYIMYNRRKLFICEIKKKQTKRWFTIPYFPFLCRFPFTQYFWKSYDGWDHITSSLHFLAHSQLNVYQKQWDLLPTIKWQKLSFLTQLQMVDIIPAGEWAKSFYPFLDFFFILFLLTTIYFYVYKWKLFVYVKFFYMRYMFVYWISPQDPTVSL